jgi:hypothetical protein
MLLPLPWSRLAKCFLPGDVVHNDPRSVIGPQVFEQKANSLELIWSIGSRCDLVGDLRGRSQRGQAERLTEPPRQSFQSSGGRPYNL